MFCGAVFTNCKSNEYILIFNKTDFIEGIPPGTVKLNDSVYVDNFELTNISWDEYVADVGLKYGFGSREFFYALPNQSVWEDMDSSYREYYYKHRAYNNYPVVGISYEQALHYSEWRTNRVLQNTLYQNGIIPIDSLMSSTFNLTVEKFYNDSTYSMYHHIPYPQYELVPVNLIPLILSFADSLNTENIKSCQQRSILYRLATEDVYCEELICKDSLISNLAGNTKGLSLDRTLDVDCYTCKKPVIFHLYGNVSEMISDSALCFGGSWKDSVNQIKINPYTKNTAPNCWTGFRNICTWKQYQKK